MTVHTAGEGSPVAKYVVIQDLPDTPPEWCADLGEVYRFITGEICGTVKAVAKIIDPVIVDPADDRTFPTTQRKTSGVAAPGMIPPGFASAISSDNARITAALTIISEIESRPITSEMVSAINRIRKALTT